MFRKICAKITYLILKVFFGLKVVGLENIPKQGRLIVYSKHTSNADPFILGACIDRYVAFMAKEELFKNKFIGSIFMKMGAFPVKRNSGDLGAVKTAMMQLKREHIMVMFPEGTRRKGNKKIKLKPGLAMIAIKTKSPVLPAAIIGKARFFSKNKLIYGKPIDLSKYYNQNLSSEDYTKIVEDLMKEIDFLE